MNPTLRNKYDIHNKVAWPVAAATLAKIVIDVLKSQGGIDLSAHEADITILTVALVGYLIPS